MNETKNVDENRSTKEKKTETPFCLEKIVPVKKGMTVNRYGAHSKRGKSLTEKSEEMKLLEAIFGPNPKRK